MGTLNITLTRNDPWTESYDIYVKPNAAPLEDGDGTFIMNLPIEPIATSVSTTWEAPDDRTWYARAVAIWRREQSPGGNL